MADWDKIRQEKDEGFAKGAAFNKAIDLVIAMYNKGDVGSANIEEHIIRWFDTLKGINTVPPRTHQNAPQQTFTQNRYQGSSQGYQSRSRTYTMKDLDSLDCNVCSSRGSGRTVVWSERKQKPYCKNWKEHKERGEYSSIVGGDKDPGEDMIGDPIERHG